MIVSVNGSLIDEQQAVVSVLDHGFLYGMGLFETFRTYKGEPFLLEAHMARLQEGCKEVGIRLDIDHLAIREQIGALLAANDLSEAYIRYSVSAGTAPLGLPTGNYDKPNVIIYAKALPTSQPHIYNEGKPLQLLNIRRNTPEGRVRLKSFHYMNNILAKRELEQYPWALGAEGLFLTEQSFIAEGLVSNLFYIEGDCLYTPSLDTGILPGITRDLIIRLAKDMRLSVLEGLFTIADIEKANAIFLTNSIQEIVPVNVIYDCTGGSIWTRPTNRSAILSRLIEAYQRQIEGNSGIQGGNL
jgi:4-amino-4-deoxychorismate lyase